VEVEAPAIIVIGGVVRLRTTPQSHVHQTAVRQS